MSEDPRATLAQLIDTIAGHFGPRLIGLYLFGSLSNGDFAPGRSDLDLIAVLGTPVAEGPDLDALRVLHEHFEDERPGWRGRIEVLYLTRDVLATFSDAPTGTVARVSPGEPLHLRELDGERGWRLDWAGVLNGGETLSGLPPDQVGPWISDKQLREAMVSHLDQLRHEVRDSDVAWVPARQGYLAATISRGLYSLQTGRQTSKAAAIEWAAHRYLAYADYLMSAFAAYRADVRGPHQRLIDFAEAVASEVE
jgi:hypothetical protein